MAREEKEVKPKVLLDMDGVVIDFLTPFLTHINSCMQTNHKLEDMSKWDMYESFDVPQNIREMVDQIIMSPGYCESLRPHDGAIEGVEALKEVADIVIVTSPWSSDTWAAERARWIKRHLGFGKDHIISARSKHHVAGDILVDDKPETLDKWAHCFPYGLPIMWHGPANACRYTLHRRCDDWKTLREIVSQRTAGPEMRLWRPL